MNAITKEVEAAIEMERARDKELKVLPLLPALRGALAGRRYTFQWLSLLVWLYFAEGVVSATSGTGNAVPLGAIEALLALALFACSAGFARITRQAAPSPKAATLG